MMKYSQYSKLWKHNNVKRESSLSQAEREMRNLKLAVLYRWANIHESKREKKYETRHKSSIRVAFFSYRVRQIEGVIKVNQFLKAENLAQNTWWEWKSKREAFSGGTRQRREWAGRQEILNVRLGDIMKYFAFWNVSSINEINNIDKSDGKTLEISPTGAWSVAQGCARLRRG